MPLVTDERWHCFSDRRPGCALVGMAFLVMSGCATAPKREDVAKALGVGAAAPANREETVADSYRLACPDVVEITVAGMADASGRFVVNADGRIELASMENPRVEGETAAGLARRVAAELGVPDERVSCRVAEHRSRTVLVRGPVSGGDRSVPYRGTENVVGFLRRCGGLTPAADVRDLHVVRGNVASGGRPQVFAVDLEAILLRGDPTTNVLLQPFDEVYVGELPRAKVGKALPHWLRPLYRGFCGVFPAACPHDWRRQIRDPEP